VIDNKIFMKGFLEYLQSYYGNASGFSMGQVPMYPNQPRLSLFQGGPPVSPDEMGMEEPMMPEPMVQQPMGGMNQMPALPGETLGQELNGMFPGPYDPMRMN